MTTIYKEIDAEMPIFDSEGNQIGAIFEFKMTAQREMAPIYVMGNPTPKRRIGSLRTVGTAVIMLNGDMDDARKLLTNDSALTLITPAE